jgi:hypothetical protein
VTTLSEPAIWPDGLYALIEEGADTFAPAICVAHRGMHRFYLGACHGLPPGQGGRERRRHGREASPEPAPTPRVEIDMEGLAGGIALALDWLMEQKRQERAPGADAPSRREGEAPLGGVPTVT